MPHACGHRRIARLPQDFENYDAEEIAKSIQTRRTRIFLLMEEVRRLRIEQRLKVSGAVAHSRRDMLALPREIACLDAYSFFQGGDRGGEAEEVSREKFISAVPFLPPLDEKTLDQYYYTYFGLVAAIILFGGLVSPWLELRLGLGGTSYLEFVESMHLPSQLAQVDPIVASFCGGAVGVLSALLLVEENNLKLQIKARSETSGGRRV